MKPNRSIKLGFIQATARLTYLLSCIALIMAGNGLYAQNSKQGQKPNVIIINADDVGYGDIGVYGATKVRTPKIDELANEGRRFTDFHSASAVCSPSRYALLTGEYPDRINFSNPIFLKTPLKVDTSKVTVADIMKEAGYATGIVGKWHLGFGKETPIDWNKDLKPGPLELGFDYYYGVPVLNSHPPFVYVENHKVVGLTSEDPMVYDKHAETRWFPEKMDMDAIGGGRAAHDLYDDRRVGTHLKNKAQDFIRNHKEKPFFLYFATTNIHHPFTPAPRFIGTSEAGRYGDFMHELDWMVGEIMQTLDEEGLAENTILIFTSDNGGMLNQGGQDAYSAGHRQNADLLGFKFDSWEGGHRVPFIIRWPGKVPAGSVSNELSSNVDFLATLASLTNRKLQEGEGIDSYNILPALTSDPSKPIRDHLVIASSNLQNVALRKGDWVYINAQGGGGFNAKKVGAHTFGGPAAFPFTGQKNSDIEDGKIIENAPPGQLYNLSEDPSQAKNVFREYPEIVKKMEQELRELRQSEQTRP
ncbi:sulfatase-like hydrolase/transferase [Salegentibacter sp. F14]